MTSFVRKPDIIYQLLDKIDKQIEAADAHGRTVDVELYKQQTALENELDFSVDWYSKKDKQQAQTQQH